MLLSIIGKYPASDQAGIFTRLLDDIKESYWPSRYLSKNKSVLKERLPHWPHPKSSDEIIHEVTAYMAEIIDDIAKENKFYVGYKDGRKIDVYEFPFTRNLFHYFIQRSYTIPYRDPGSRYDDLFRLEREVGYEKNVPEETIQGYNYSKNYGDYNHFLNVVIATARLIEYFSNAESFAAIFKDEAPHYSEILSYNWRDLSDKEGAKRCYLLMLSAFFHDLGKTIVYPRHAMEGSILIANHTTRPVYLLNKISTQAYGFEFGSEDFLLVSHLVYYHDQYGTLDTGEAGYLRLVDLLHRIKRFSYRGVFDGDTEGERESERNRVLRCVFDLWVLNVADMIVSIPSPKYGDKFQLQMSLFDAEKTRARIEDILIHRNARKHDLYVTFSLVDQICKKHHSDDLAGLELASLDYARRHAVERISRLLRAILVDYMPHYERTFLQDSRAFSLLKEMSTISEPNWHAIISRSIIHVSDFNEFVHRFAWVGQMDYSFSFFQKIAQRALQRTEQEIVFGSSASSGKFGALKQTTPHVFPCGWSYKSEFDDCSDDFLLLANAKFFAENFSSILVQLLHHLLFREKEFDRLINFEFRDAAERLTEEKIDRIISAEGPHRAKRAIQLALEGVYFFK